MTSSAFSHAVTMNGRSSTQLTNLAGGTLDEELIRRVKLLDGGRRFSLILWRIPAGLELDDVDFDALQEYIQCAGAFGAQMMCEIREAGHQYVLGRGGVGDDGSGAQDVVIEWDGGIHTAVRSNEALSGDEVAELFVSYLATDREPAGYHRREIVS